MAAPESRYGLEVQQTSVQKQTHLLCPFPFQFYMIWDLHGWVQRDLPATDRNGESSSPDVPAGTGGTKV